MQKNQLDFATRCVHAGQEPDPTTGAIMMPIYTTSTYVQQSPGVHKGYDYARTKNPTRMAFERCIADLEGGTAAFAFASGIAGIATTLDCLDAGSHIIAVDDLYGGSRRLFERVRRRSAGLEFTYLDLTDPAVIEPAIRPNTRLIWIETPTNPLLKLVDLARVAALAKPRGIWTVADNTFASPYVQRPLEYGFDLVVHSTTKYLNGHSDMIGGVAVAGTNGELRERMQFLQNAVGAIQGPFELLPRAARAENSGPAHGAPLRVRARDRIVAGATAQGPAGVLSRACEPSSARARKQTDARIRRHDLRRACRHAGGCAAISRALPPVRAG